MKIYDRIEKKFVEVHCIKRVKFPSHPRNEFFVHRTLGARGKCFSCSDLSTGVAAVTHCDNVKGAVERTRGTLKNLPNDSTNSVGSLKACIEKAKKEVLTYLPETVFPVNK